MRNVGNVLLLILVVALMSMSGCGKKSGFDKAFHDPNCILGQEDMVKSGRYIAGFVSITKKAKMINLKVGKKTVTVTFNDATQWNWSKMVTDIKLLKEKKGCLAVDVKMEGGKKIATAITILSPYEVPENQKIEIAEIKELMKGIPNKNDKLVIVDSRPPFRFNEGHIPGAVNITLNAMKSGKGFAKLPGDKTAVVVFYCGGLHCKLSPFSSKIAVEKGYSNVRVYVKGYPDWKKSKMPGYSLAALITSNQKKKMPMVLLDVRKDAKTDHIPGAVAVSAATLGAYKAQLPKGADMKRAPLIVYGKDASGDDIAFGLAMKLTAMGYENVTVLEGGIDAYKKAGGKTESNKLAGKINYVHKFPAGHTSDKAFYTLIEKGIPADMVLLDVRETVEVNSDPAMTLLGARAIPLGDLGGKIASLDTSKKYYVFCTSGMRAAMARNMLDEKGLKAFYVAAKVKGDAAAGIEIGKVKISTAQIKQLGGKVPNKKAVPAKAVEEDEGC